MTPAEIAATRKLMGLTAEQLGAELGINPRTVRGWESGKYAPTQPVVAALRSLRAEHDALVAALIEQDAELAVLPRGPKPQGWYLALGARLLDRRPDLRLDWVGHQPQS